MFLHAISFGIITAAVMALAAVGCTVQFGVTNILNLARPVLARGNPPSPTANYASCVSASHSAPSRDFGYVRIRSLGPSQNEHAIQRDPNEVIIGM